MYRTRSKNLFPNSVRIGLVDPNVAQTWAQRTSPDGTIVGEVKKGDTINHTTSQPIANGLFCQRIFGPCVDYTCACGQTKIPIHSNIHVSSDVCPDCLVEWTESSVRRHRLGFIQLISPVTHKWFADSGSAYIPALMGTTVKTFKAVRDCKLFFPFSLQNINRQQTMHSFYCEASIAKAKSKSGDLLLRYLLCNGDTFSLSLPPSTEQSKRGTTNKKKSIKNSFDTAADLESFVGFDSSRSFALPAVLLYEVSSKEHSKQGEGEAKGAKDKGKDTPATHGVLQEALMGGNLRAMQKIVAASYERYINKQAKIKKNGVALAAPGFNLHFDPIKEKTQNPIRVAKHLLPAPCKAKAQQKQWGSKVREGVYSLSEQNYNSSTSHFNGYHSFPVRPSFAQSEDYRRKFVKFFGNTGATSFALQEANKLLTSKSKKFGASFIAKHEREVKKTIASQKKHRQFRDIPIVRYTQQCQSGLPYASFASFASQKAKEAKEIAKPNKPNSTAFLNKAFPNKQVYNCIVRHPEFPIKSYFSEINSAAKEQTIKRILAQTGGGGLQKYLSLVDLGYLVALLKNDLDEITPHLDRYKYAKLILRNALNKTSSDLSQTYNLLEKLQTNYWATVEQLTGDVPTGPELFEKIARLEENYEYGKQEYKAAKKLYKILEKRKTAHKRRYKLASQLWRTMSNPVGLTMSSVPVLPPGLRPIIDVPKVGPIASDLNVRYRKLVFALRNLRDLSYVDFRITGAAQSSVQEAVDDILYTGGKRKTVIKTQSGLRSSPSVYKSLAMGLKGKHGRFRGNLLGKRVDYSGRSVIVVGPTLKIHQCGLPFELAIKLFHPFLIRRLMQKGFCKTVYAAKKALGNGRFNPQLWTLCREEMLEHLVVLNRAPTLHRLGVQAFMPVLITGRAILLHPLVCTAFNADFDGDQMAVHVPLFPQAKAEAWKMMWSRNNFLAPSSGDPILLPSQDMVLGCYYLTESVLEPLKNVCFTFSKSRVFALDSLAASAPASLALLRKGEAKEAKTEGNNFAEAGKEAAQSKSSPDFAVPADLPDSAPYDLLDEVSTKVQQSQQVQLVEHKQKREKSIIANCSKLLLESGNFTLLDPKTPSPAYKVKPEEVVNQEAERLTNTQYYEIAPTVLHKHTPEILSVKAALDGYTKGVYNLHSIVWVSPNGAVHINYKSVKEDIFHMPLDNTKLISLNKSRIKEAKEAKKTSPTFTTFNGAGLSSSFAKKPLLNQNRVKQSNTSPWKSLIPNGLEGDKSSTPTLELRVSPYGITRLFQITGSKKRNFYSAMLLPTNRAIKNSSFEIASIRTTIGRLLFNDLLQKFEITSFPMSWQAKQDP